MEDAAALGPVALHAGGDQVLVARDEEEVVVHELLPHLFSPRHMCYFMQTTRNKKQPHLLVHAEQGEVVALEIPAELAEGGLHKGLHVKALLLGDAGREAKSLDAAADADPHRLDGSP